MSDGEEVPEVPVVEEAPAAGEPMDLMHEHAR